MNIDIYKGLKKQKYVAVPVGSGLSQAGVTDPDFAVATKVETSVSVNPGDGQIGIPSEQVVSDIQSKSVL